MRWRAFYADGSSVASSDSSWTELPSDGLVVLKVWRGRGKPKEIHAGADAIWWTGRGRVFNLDLPPGIEEWAEAELEAGRLKRGALMPDQAYAALYARALEARR